MKTRLPFNGEIASRISYYEKIERQEAYRIGAQCSGDYTEKRCLFDI